nr:signal peptidase I [Sulfurospirillum arcachonense]
MRYKIIAIILNIIAIGSGHFYINNYKKALFLLLIPIFIVYLFYFISTIYFNKYVFIINILIILSFYIYSIYDVIKTINISHVEIEYKALTSVFFYLIIVSLLVSLFIYFMPIKILTNPSMSMSSTIITGDSITVIKNNNAINRGEIAIINYPKNPDVLFVKRCVAVGGDEVLFQDKHLYISFHEGEAWMKENYPQNKLHVIAGKTWVLNPYKEKFPGIQYDEDVNLFAQMKMFLSANDFAMQPAVVAELPKNLNAAFNAFYKRVPEGEFYMVGDNRDHSNDSRFWGSVPKELIYGKPYSIYFSEYNYEFKWNRIGIKLL